MAYAGLARDAAVRGEIPGGYAGGLWREGNQFSEGICMFFELGEKSGEIGEKFSVSNAGKRGEAAKSRYRMQANSETLP